MNIFRAERAAAIDPSSAKPIDEEMFDSAMRRMAAGQLDESLIQTCLSKTTGLLSTPSFLKSPNLAAWLSIPDVKTGLRRAVAEKLLGTEPPKGLIKNLEASFIKIAFAGAREASGLVETVIAILAASVKSRVDDRGVGALITASHLGITSELHEIRSHLERSFSVSFRTLDMGWDDWAKVATPPLIGSLFSSAIEASKRTVLSWISQPPEKPLIITADSAEEAIAFISQLFGELGGKELSIYREKVIIIDQTGALPRLAAEKKTFIPVVFSREVELELATHANLIHSLVIYPRNALNNKPDIILEPVSQNTFSSALESMGKPRDEISRLSDASGRSLTVLRRKLSTVPAVQLPEWAADGSVASQLIPFLFVGAWDTSNQSDKIGLNLLSGVRNFDDIEKELQSLCHLNDSPVWSIGTFRGVVSKIDLLYAIAGVVTSADLERYFTVARMVLGEDDPSLDLEEDQRWAASIHGKTREFSSAFRQGISETLVLLAVHGQQLFDVRLGVQTNSEVIRTIRELLPTPLTTRILEANDHDLATYAEAAPDEFLSIIERDLNSESPAVFGLLRPVNSGVFGSSPSRTGLLWALEGLAWAPNTLPRATFILARLAQIEINDNWVNKPAHSLEAIFRSWMPQTAASLQDRIALMKRLAERFPDVAWKICIAQFGTHAQFGGYSHKPRWRPDGYGFGEPLIESEPRIEFVREMTNMVLSWHSYSVEKLCDLVEQLSCFSEDDQSRVWKIIVTWAQKTASDSDKAAMREKIRLTTLSRGALMRAKRNGSSSDLAAAGKEVYEALEPTEIINRHSWLFRNGWIEESADDLENIEEVDFEAKEKQAQDMRVNALREIFERHGSAGILELAQLGQTSWVIGALSANYVLSRKDLEGLLTLTLPHIKENGEFTGLYKNLVRGIIRSLADNDVRREVIANVTRGHPEVQIVEILLLSMFSKDTWAWVDTLSLEGQRKYWEDVTPEHIHDSPPECNESVERLLAHGRPRAAFSGVRHSLKKINPEIIVKLLWAIVRPGKEQNGRYMLDKYYVQEAFKQLNDSGISTVEQMASLEFAYIDVLGERLERQEGYQIPNLERYIESHPEFFVQAICWVYKRSDEGVDPLELQVVEEQVQTMARRGMKLLQSLKCIPGHNDRGELESNLLLSWIVAVRDACDTNSRNGKADYWIGELLANAPVGMDGVWPCEPVREVIEHIQSERMVHGAQIGIFNMRGVHLRGEDGAQEREIAEKYRIWSEALRISHPFVSSQLLLKIAKSYDCDALREDTNAGVRRRLN
ncbi:addiction module antitoxin [Pseudomonas veronii]|uniref:Addiction module antitoxin n=1 Tax=Pseudomonas veronii TaxID=76761 RepID=A0A5M8EN80_PSEVE|nr:addiction module antitoxin [Pseudomonas veronii]KAA6170512.1 addiction module antitoxin [Pseudomonas veronii]KAA6172136.1 addiction module antitoxin [Pseudomonas veronii]